MSKPGHFLFYLNVGPPVLYRYTFDFTCQHITFCGEILLKSPPHPQELTDPWMVRPYMEYIWIVYQCDVIQSRAFQRVHSTGLETWWETG